MDPISDSVIGLGAKLIDTVAGFIPNPEEKLKAQLAMQAQIQTAALQAAQSQLEIDSKEAESPSMFVAGWRPAVGWICGFGLAWQYVLMPISAYVINIVATFWHKAIPPLPALDNSTLYPLLMALLGLGGMHAYERVQGVANDTISSDTTTNKK